MDTFVARESRYHFLVKDWKSINDLDVMEKTFSTEYFRLNMKPIEPNIQDFKTVLVISPHQDDESIGCGGLLHKLSDLKAQIHVVYTTNGAQQLKGTSPEDVAMLRNEEAKKALEFVGGHFHQLDISNMKPRVNVDHIEELSQLIHQLNPDLILIPWFLDYPIKHRLSNHMLYFAYHLNAWSDCQIWGYQVHNHLYPNIAIDITDQIDKKFDMISCFKTQNKIKDYPHVTRGLNAYNSKFLFHSNFTELFFGLPAKEYIDLVEEIYAKDLKHVYKGNQDYVENIELLEKSIVKE